VITGNSRRWIDSAVVRIGAGALIVISFALGYFWHPGL
jgi:hypothetical protein